MWLATTGTLCESGSVPAWCWEGWCCRTCALRPDAADTVLDGLGVVTAAAFGLLRGVSESP